LTREEADRLIDAVCDRAAKLNKDTRHPFTYQTIYLFGSCLNHKEHPGDVDLALEIRYRGGGELPQPSPIPFVPAGDFGRATGSLYGRGERFKISLHHYRELLAMGTPHKCIWTRKTGRLQGAIIRPTARPESKIAITRTKSSEQNYQKQIDALAARIRAVQRWPKPPALELSGVKEVSPSKWRKLQANPWVLAHAHEMCLPECATKTALAKALAKCKSREANYGKRWAAAYVKTSMRLNPWTFRANGRLLRKSPASTKRTSVRERGQLR
jgi:hypothetical protein